jgi:hypothetical protein
VADLSVGEDQLLEVVIVVVVDLVPLLEVVDLEEVNMEVPVLEAMAVTDSTPTRIPCWATTNDTKERDNKSAFFGCGRSLIIKY